MSAYMTSLVGSIGWALIHFIWQGTLLGCATAIALLLMGRARPEQRYAVACTGLLACLLLPSLAVWRAMASSDPGNPGEIFADIRMAVGTSEQAGNLLDLLQPHLGWVVGFWALCASLLSLRLVLGLAWIGRTQNAGRYDAQWQARTTAMASRFGVARKVRLVVAEHLDSPLTAGWWRPVVLVPAALFTGMPPDMLDALLAHEMAHIKRHDYLVNLVQNVIEILLFYHPAVWWISRRIRIEREQIADDYAARQLGEPRRLALALFELERIQFSNHHLAQAANGGDLMNRITRLLRPETPALNWKAAIPVLGLTLACATLYAHASSSSGATAPVPAAATPTVAAPAAPETGAPTVASTPAAASQAVSNSKPGFADLYACKPNYPKESISKGEAGAVFVSFVVNAKGKLVGAKVDKSSGFPLLDEATRSALSKCKFRAAVKNGKKIESAFQAEYLWQLPD